MAKVLLKVTPQTGDPIKKIGDTVLPAGKGRTDQEFDIRDRLAELVGKGNTLNTDDKAAIYGSLVASLGKNKAQKVMNHAYLFNARPDVQSLPLEDKLRSFYTIGSNDPDVNALIAKSKTLGYGAVPGFRQSSSAINQQLSGQVPANGTINTSVAPEIQKRVMLQVRK
jgi:hypothetical protein